MVLFGWTAALAHHPHDPVDLFAVSPSFSDDGVAFVSRYPAQNWRVLEIARTRDGGSTWVPSHRGITNVAALSGLEVSPRFDEDGVVLVTTEGDGAFLSLDGGESFDPVYPGRVLDRAAVAHDGDHPVLFVHEVAVALWRSDDLGRTWTSVAPVGVMSALSAHHGLVAWSEAGTVWRSDDVGRTFSETPMPFTAIDLSVVPGAVAAATTAGVYVSADDQPFTLLPNPRPTYSVALSPGYATDHTLLEGGAEVAWISRDGGATLVELPTGFFPSDQTDVHVRGVAFAADWPRDPTLFVNAFEGLVRSTDGGASFVEFDLKPPALVNTIATSPHFADDGTVYVGSYDAGGWASTDRGATFQIRNDGLARASVYDSELVDDGQGGVTAFLALREIVAAGPMPSGPFPVVASVPQLGYLARIAMSPSFATDGIGLAGTRVFGLWRTTDGGITWQNVSDLPSEFTSIAWGEDGSTVLAATNGVVLRSADAGATWVTVAPLPGVDDFSTVVSAGPGGFLVGTPAGLYTSTDGFVFDVVESLAGPVHQVFVAADGTRFAAMRGAGLWRSDDGGPFVQIGQGLTSWGHPAEIEATPSFADDGIVFAAVDDELFRSDDRGDDWVAVGPVVVRYEEDTQNVLPAELRKGGLRFQTGASASYVLRVAKGETLIFQFVGTSVRLIGPGGPELGEGDVSVDGGPAVAVSARRSSYADQQVLFASETLAPGPHVLTIRPTAGWVSVDAFDVTRPLPDFDVADDPVETEPGVHTAVDTGGSGSTVGRRRRPEDGCGCGSPGAPGWGVGLALLALRRRRA